ncbi:uncharacterized protein [Misgurnus anguillicaudatus]|uniref:uncharacterized protein isoform X1 n=1 Tax=Misgurnus anguillicaudatus TaxID=75329 RepID=UPI003CCF0062
MATADNLTALPFGPVHMDRREREEERRQAGWSAGKEARGGSGRHFTMEEGKNPTSEIYLPSISLGFVEGEKVQDHELPIISVSKSSTEMVSGSFQHTEVPWCHQHLHKSVSSTASTVRPASMGGPATRVPVTLCDYDQGSMCSGNSTSESVIWHGETARPWSITEGSPRRTQDLLLAQNQTHRRVPCSPSTNRDLRMKGLVSREGYCQCCGPAENFSGCSCCRMGSSVGKVANTVDHAPNNCESQHLSACRRSACAGHVMNTTCLRNVCSAVPCPGHLLSRPACTGSPCAGQRSMLHSGLLGFPPLVSSVSETRLDSRSAVHCCGSELHGQNSSCLRTDRPDHDGHNRTTKDATTMTSEHKLRDIGVQTMSSNSLGSSMSHLFPEINLRADPILDASVATERNCHRSPVKEVEWDAEGMTWEVYGASVDPEELGLAIQKHLELQIKETAAAAAARCESSETVNGLALQSRRRKKSEGIIRSLRSSACCSNTSTLED